MQIQKTADNLKRIQAQLEKKNKSLTGDLVTQRTQLNQQVFSAQQEADKVRLFCPALPCPPRPVCPALHSQPAEAADSAVIFPSQLSSH